MEGKAILFKEFADVDAFPIVLDTKEVDEIVETIVRIAPTLGGINLEDISAPRCFEIEKKLKERLNIPVFHDDQHGTAIIVLAALINALKIVNKNIQDLKIVVNGAGSAGTAITKLLLSFGAKNIIVCDRDGALNRDTTYSNKYFEELSQITNPNNESGILKDVIKNADVFIGVSAPNINEEMKIAAAYAIANSVSDEELNSNYIIPKAFNLDVQKKVAEAVKEAAIKSGVATI